MNNNLSPQVLPAVITGVFAIITTFITLKYTQYRRIQRTGRPQDQLDRTFKRYDRIFDQLQSENGRLAAALERTDKELTDTRLLLSEAHKHLTVADAAMNELRDQVDSLKRKYGQA